MYMPLAIKSRVESSLAARECVFVKRAASSKKDFVDYPTKVWILSLRRLQQFVGLDAALRNQCPLIVLDSADVVESV
jgi:hypothetical protein